MTELNWSCRGLDRIEKALRACTTNVQRRPLLIRKACFLARLSRTDEARGLLQSTSEQRQVFEPRMSAWALFCEGLIEHFDSLSSQALGKFKRAQAVSIAAGDLELIALTSSWIANGEFVAGNLGAVPAPLLQAFQYADISNSSALGRACLVVADSLNWSGQAQEARKWYREAREHAVEEGDISMQSVLLFNDVAFRVAHLVLQDCEGRPSAHEMQMASMSLDSVRNLDMGLGVARLTSMVPLLRAELHSVERRWEEAVALFDVFLADDSVQAHGRLMPKFVAQRAYCHAMLGDMSSALRDVERSLVASVTCSDMDDLYVLYSRVASVLEQGGKADASAAHRRSASRCKEAFEDMQGQLRASLSVTIESIMQRRAAQQKSPA